MSTLDNLGAYVGGGSSQSDPATPPGESEMEDLFSDADLEDLEDLEESEGSGESGEPSSETLDQEDDLA